MSNLPVKVDNLQRELDQITTPEQARELADKAKAVAAACKAANLGFQVQNETAALRLRAEHKLGELLTETITPGRWGEESLSSLGISKSRSSRAQRLASLSVDDLNLFLAQTMAAEKEITQNAALKLVPTTPKEVRSNIAATYTAPPIDIAIAREFGMEADDALAELLVTTIQHALATMRNPKHAYVWARYHGIQDDGTIGDKWTFDGIAQSMGSKSREYAESLYYRASHHIRGAIALAALRELRRSVDGT